MTALDTLIRESFDPPRDEPSGRSEESVPVRLDRDQLATLRLAARLVDEARGYVEGIDRGLARQMAVLAARLRRGIVG